MLISKDKMDIQEFKEAAKKFRAKRNDNIVLGHIQYDSNDLSYRAFFETDKGLKISDEEVLKEMGITFLRLPGQAGIDFIRAGNKYDLLIIDKHSHKGLKEIGEIYDTINPYIVKISREQNPNVPIAAYWDGFVNKIQGVDVVRDSNFSTFTPCIRDVTGLVDNLVHKIEKEKSAQDIFEISRIIGKSADVEYVFAR